MPSAPSSLYIHIPFCRSKCSYCDFFSKPHDGQIPDSYMSALCSNIAFRAAEFGVREWNTVYVGGGTPSLLSENQLNTLMEAVRHAAPLSPDAEITVEANPQDITGQWLKGADGAGFNRLSVGVQAVDQAVLRAVGRRSDAERVEEALSLIERIWVRPGHRFSADLIAGLPYLTGESFVKGVERVMASGADHISLYALTLEEGTRLEDAVSKGQIPYSEAENDRQWLLGRDLLEHGGFRQYEVSNFARKGFESRHNTVYWHMQDYIGAGAGACGTVQQKRWTETSDIHSYVNFWNGDGAAQPQAASITQPPAETELLDKHTREFEFLMMGFRLLEGVNSAEYSRRFGEPGLASRLGAAGGLFQDWERRGLAHITRGLPADGDGAESENYALTRDGILLLNRFLEELL